MEAAVVSFAEGTVKSLIGKLGTVLAEEALLLGGVRGEIQYIKDELESMTAFLIVQAEKEEYCNRLVKVWMKQVREMAYDAEDCIDKFRYRIDKPCEKGLSGIIQKSALVLRTLKARHQLATEIQDLKRRTREVSERQLRYHAPAGESSKITSHASDSLIPYPQLHALYPEQVQPVGFDEHRDQIIGWLMDGERPRLTVVSIVGFGGLGKTTLAKMAYESSTIKAGNFQCQAFVAVSQRFDVKLILKDIFQQVLPIPNNKDTSGMNDDEREAQMLARKFSEKNVYWDVQTLVTKLRNYLNNKRYVIILDDIWDASAWENFKIALPDCKKGSRIIVTTRIESVANECSRDEEPHIFKMKPLDPETSKMLFYKRLFSSNDDLLSAELKKVLDDILKKCGGMPLAINSVAGLLASKPKQPNEWKTILNSLGSELETNPTLEGMRKILFLSYQNLPYYLKTCFLYLSIYPEDYGIKTKRLTRRWIHEGFVSSKRGLRAEEVAKIYFYELVNRNMVIPMDISPSGEIKGIRVHDMMLEIAVSKSLEENFVSLVGNKDNLMYDKIRRLSIHSIGQNNLTPGMKMNLSHTRSLTVFGNSPEWAKSEQLRLVRLLDLEGTHGLRNGHLKYLCKMFQLRYLSLRGTDISRLPSKIKKLQNLETLDIRDTRIWKLPSGITKLQNLSYLKGGTPVNFTSRMLSAELHGAIRMPRGVQNMKNIRTLNLVEYTSMKHELGKLINLGVRVRYCINVPETKPFLLALDKLSLCLRSLAMVDMGEGYFNWTLHLNSLESPPTLLQSLQLCDTTLEALPLWFPSMSDLTKLNLVHTQMLNENDFKVLQELPNLIILYQVGTVYNSVNELVFIEKGFPSLKVFTYEAGVIPVLKFRERAASKLQKLALEWFSNDGSESFNLDGIEHLQSLNEVALKFRKESNISAAVIKGLKDVIDFGLNGFKLTVEYSNW